MWPVVANNRTRDTQYPKEPWQVQKSLRQGFLPLSGRGGVFST